MKITDITLATHNEHKLKEFSNFFAPLGIKIHSEKEFCDLKDVEETGKTYFENALLKAKAIKPYSPFPVLADDSGIEIEALGEHFPGIFTARYLDTLSPNRIKALNILLDQLKDNPNRKAAFHCTLLLLEEEKETAFEGICEGEILKDIKGKEGFGYDPIFHSFEGNANFGEISEEEKMLYSHRGKALQKLFAYLKEE